MNSHVTTIMEILRGKLKTKFLTIISFGGRSVPTMEA
jgi:hypothetical protein